MSKAVKAILVICAIAVAAGLVIGGVGVISGGMRAVSFEWDNGLKVVTPGSLTAQEFSKPLAQADNLNVTAEACKLNFVEGDSFMVSGQYDPDYWDLSVDTQGTTLNIGLKMTKDFFGMFSLPLLSNAAGASTELTVTVPRDTTFKSLTINGSAIDADIGSLSADSLTLSVSANSFTADKLTCSDLDLESSAGSVTIGQLDATSSAVISLSAGKLDITQGSLTGLAFKLSMGTFNFNGTLSGRNTISASAGTANLNLQQSSQDIAFSSNVSAGSFTVNNRDVSGFINSGSTGSNSNATSLSAKVSAGTVNVTTQ